MSGPDLSSSTLFYRRVDSVSVLEPEEERALGLKLEETRCDMLRAILAVPSGRTMIIDPIERMGRAERITGEILDTSHWDASDGVIPRGRRADLRALLSTLAEDGPDAGLLERLRFNWPRVLDVGKAVFELLGTADDLHDELEALSGCAGSGGPEELLELAVRFLDPSVCYERDACLAWRYLPRLQRARRRLVELELATGLDLGSFRQAGEAFVGAIRRHDQVVETLVETNLRLVVKWARKYHRPSAMEEMDLIQEGCQGLIEAARRFDTHKGYRFSTYAVWWIRQALVRGMLRKSRIVRLPATAIRRHAEMAEAIRVSVAETGRHPSEEELASSLSLDPAQVRSLQASLVEPVFLDRRPGDFGRPLSERMASGIEDPGEHTSSHDLKERLSEALSQLSEKERTVLSLRFGLRDGQAQSLDSVSRVFGVSRERVRQVELRALRKLRMLAPLAHVDPRDDGK